MKYNMIKRGISILLSAGLLLGLCACSDKQEAVKVEPMEVEEVQSLTFDITGGKDVMPITGYYGPMPSDYSFDAQSLPDYFTDEMFEMISDCGINLLQHSYTNYETAREQALLLMDLCEKYKMGACVFDSQVYQKAGDDALTLEQLAERINEYSDHPAFCGVYVVDEPGTPYFGPSEGGSRDVSRYVPIFQNLKELGIFGTGNLRPAHEVSEYEKWEQYIDEWCSTCEPMYLSYDFYVFDDGKTKEGHFYNLDTIRKYAEKYELPFWCYVQAGGQWNDTAIQFDSEEYYPTEGELLWNVNTYLAYGAKGIEYFPILQPYYYGYALSEDFDFQRNGLIGAWGNKTQWWHYAKKANAQIAAVDHVLMNAVNKGVIVTGENAVKETKGLNYIMEETSWRELQSIEGNTMVGCFNYQGKTALYVVNYETEYAQKVTLNLQDSYKLSVIQNTEESKVKTSELTLDMQPGEGVLVVFE